MTSPDRSPRPSSPLRRVLAMLALAVLALSLVSLGAGAEHDLVLSTPDPSSREVEGPELKNDYWEPDWQTEENVEKEDPVERDNTGTTVFTALVILAGIALLILIGWIARRVVALRPETRESAEALEDPELFTVEEAEEAVERARASLASSASAHEAVIEAWLALERTIAQGGVRRRPTQTTREYVLTVLETVSIDTSGIDRLADLYRRAMFDAHPITEDDREEARRLLDEVSSEIRSRRQEARR